MLKLKRTKAFKGISVILCLLFLNLSIVGCGGGGGGDGPAPAPATNADVSGDWEAFHTTTNRPGTEGPDILNISQSGSNLTFTILVGGRLENGTGTISGSTIRITWSEVQNGTTYTTTGTGTVSGDSISGSWTDNEGGSGDWWADREGGVRDTTYNVYGGQVALYGTDGYNPEQYGYVFLGSSSTTKTFNGSYNYYIIASTSISTTYIDAVQGSNGEYYGTSITGNTLDWENISGPPDGNVATLGYQRTTTLLSGYIVIDAAGDGLTSVRVFHRDGSSDPIDNDFPGVYATSTDDPTYPSIAVNDQEEKVVIVAEGGTPSGAIWYDESGNEVKVKWNNNTGYPTLLLTGGYTFVFSQWTATTVDIAVINPSGDISVQRGVSVNATTLSKLQSYFNSGLNTASHDMVPSSLDDIAWYDWLQIGGLMLSAGTCAALYMGVVTGPLGLVCTGALVSALAAGTNSLGLTALSTGFSAVGCITSPAATIHACAGLIISVIGAVGAMFDQQEQDHSDEIPLAIGAIDYGSGSVQITLTWNTTADIDLHVKDPSGEEIYFNHKTSSSGGQLDVDDRNGYGPENIFWPTGEAPSGTYQVYVDHYSGATPTTWKILVNVNGTTNTYNGTITSADIKKLVTSFMVN